MLTFAEKLKRLREQAGLTQAALALQAGLSIGIVRDYEQGRKEPALRSAFKLAEALGVSCESFKECFDADTEDKPSAKPKRKAPRLHSSKRKS
jgi:transcriptional regulator with XRE-family HTH domain